jgi:hypothetical protein
MNWNDYQVLKMPIGEPMRLSQEADHVDVVVVEEETEVLAFVLTTVTEVVAIEAGDEEGVEWLEDLFNNF